MLKRIARLTVVVAVLMFAAAVWAETPKEVAKCRDAYWKARNELNQIYLNGRQGGKITEAEAKRFGEIEKNLNAHLKEAEKNGLTLAECQQLIREVDRDRVQVQAMALTSPQEELKISQCRMANIKAHSDVMNIYQKARNAGKISEGEAKEYAAMESRLRAREEALKKDGLTLSECEQITREIALERRQVEAMAANTGSIVDEDVNRCRQANAKARTELVKIYEKARNAGKITKAEAKQFEKIQKQLNDHEKAYSKGGLSIGECQTLTREIASARISVESMASK